jgi:hypothetical protein
MVRGRDCSQGQEASYGALSYVPFLVGKLLIGGTGFLLAALCPEGGPRNPAMMCDPCPGGIDRPIGLIALRRYIRVPEAGG